MAKTAVSSGVIELRYSLSELPTSQHKAGLVGLLLVIDELKKLGIRGVDAESSDQEATISLSESGLKALLDELYDASEELQGRAAPLKGVEPAEVSEEKVFDNTGKKEKTKKVYYYPVIVPRGSFLEINDNSDKKIWIKLWRDMVWQILRGVPATRGPYEDRASKKESSDVSVLWKQLNQDKDRSIDLPSTYFLGAQAFNSERVPFKDNGKAQFLLHFWPLVCQIYIPQTVDREGKRSFQGYVVAIPDVSRLKAFKSDFHRIWNDRTSQAVGFRPKDAVIEIPEEAGLDMVRRLKDSVGGSAAKQETADLIFGVDVFHTLREGNNVRLLFSGRVEPEAERDQKYATIRSLFVDSSFRRLRIINLLKGKSWYCGFDGLLSNLPIEVGLCSSYFAHDVRVSLEAAEADNLRRNKMKAISGEPVTSEDVCLESLILKIIDGYLRRKLKDKFSLEWSKIQDDPRKKAEYNERREGLGKECFYAIRSRNEEDFINYFASTICSVPHWMTADEYTCISRKLYDETEKVKTLSMLALSARVGREKKENKDDE